jgi:hypothetical protein
MICSKAKQKCVGAVWARASGGSSGSAEIVVALTEIVSVMREMNEELANIREVVEDRFNGPAAESESESEGGDMELDQGELAELKAEKTCFEGYRAWAVEMGKFMWKRRDEGEEEEEDGEVVAE